MVTNKQQTEKSGKICENFEFCSKILQKDDLFCSNSNNLLIYIELACFVLAIITGVIIRNINLITVESDFFERSTTEKSVKFIGSFNKEEYCKCYDYYYTNNKSYGGDPRIQKTGKGSLDIDFEGINRKKLSSNHHLARGGFSNDIETIFLGPDGLKNGENGSKNNNNTGIGYGPGYESGFYKHITRHIKENNKPITSQKLDFTYFFAKYGLHNNRALVIKNTGDKNIEGKWVLEFDLMKPMYWKPENDPEVSCKIDTVNVFFYHYTFTGNNELCSGETIILGGMVLAVLMLDLPDYIVNITLNGHIPAY